MNYVFIIALFGLIVSIYAVYVEYKHKKNKRYRAMCDIRKNISCTKAFSSKYGRLAGVSNSIIGVMFYALILLLNYLGFVKEIIYLSFFAFLGTLYLVYVSYFKLKNFCLVCTAIYVINTFLLISSYFAWLGEIFV